MDYGKGKALEHFLSIRNDLYAVNQSKGGNRKNKYKCTCGYYTGRKFNFNLHKEKYCGKSLSSTL
jgi:hypothetical protein